MDRVSTIRRQSEVNAGLSNVNPSMVRKLVSRTVTGQHFVPTKLCHPKKTLKQNNTSYSNKLTVVPQLYVSPVTISWWEINMPLDIFRLLVNICPMSCLADSL